MVDLAGVFATAQKADPAVGKRWEWQGVVTGGSVWLKRAFHPTDDDGEAAGPIHG